MSSNTIIRAARNSENPYAQISRSLFEDDRISWQAKGMMGYLLSRKNGWKVFVADLQKRSTNGRDSCYKILDELGQFGYLERIELREKGRIKGYEYVIHEVSSDERAASWKAVSGKAVSGKAVSGETVSGKTDTSNNLIQVSTEQKEEEVVVPAVGEDATSQTTTATSPQDTGTENGSGASAEPRMASVTHQGDTQAPPELEASQTTSNGNVPGAAARSALRRGFSETFLVQLLGEFEDRLAWLDLPPPRIDELLRAARLAQGSNYKTSLIAALDDDVKATKARASPKVAATVPVKPKVSARVLEALKGGSA